MDSFLTALHGLDHQQNLSKWKKIHATEILLDELAKSEVNRKRMSDHIASFVHLILQREFQILSLNNIDKYQPRYVIDTHYYNDAILPRGTAKTLKEQTKKIKENSEKIGIHNFYHDEIIDVNNIELVTEGRERFALYIAILQDYRNYEESLEELLFNSILSEVRKRNLDGVINDISLNSLQWRRDRRISKI